MKSKEDIDVVQVIVRDSIHRLDPYSLLSGSSPKDEFDSEIMSIVGQLHRCKSESDVAHTIARVLSSAFGDKYDPSDFQEEGVKIYTALKENGLV